jgi:hypothetical protein
MSKLAPGLPAAPSAVTVKLVEPGVFDNWLTDHDGIRQTKAWSRDIRMLSLKGPAAWRQLLNAPGVEAIDRHRRPATESLLGEFDFSLNRITAVQSLFPVLSGEGTVISVKEKPFDVNDLDLKGRLVVSPHFNEAPTLHATFMATLCAGSGNTRPGARAAAWGAGITSSDFDRLLPDDAAELASLGVTVQNHSYGVGVENYYGIESSEYDQEVTDNPYILHVFSAGNEGDEPGPPGAYAGVTAFANLTGQFKVSKNALTVGSCDRLGNVISSSSRGPAHDGRVKPELVAFGDAGTSESSAVVAGIAALLQQRYRQLHGQWPDAALIKAILINSASDTGRPRVDFESGFGVVDALQAVKTIEQGRTFSGTVAGGQTVTYPFTVPAGVDEVKITLAWSDPAAPPMSTNALVNDLDLTLYESNTAISTAPWVLNASPSALTQHAVRGVDRINNLEQVTITSPLPGDFEIRVHGFAVAASSQAFHVAVQTSEGFEWTFPLGRDAMASGSESRLRWRWAGTFPATGRLQVRPPGSTWTELEPDTDLSSQGFDWTVPVAQGLYQVRMILAGDTIESEEFVISTPERLRVGFVCESEAMLLWSPQSGATGYRLYRLGDRYLEPVQLSADTFATVINDPMLTTLYSLAPMYGPKEGLRELTVDYTAQGVGCYVINFLAQSYLVQEQASFTLTVGTLFGLRSVTLERLEPDGFRQIQSVVPSASAVALTDAQPMRGLHTYRARLETEVQGVIYSAEAEVLHVPYGDVIIHPNPVSADRHLRVVTNDEGPVDLRLYDRQGRLVLQAGDLGPEKSIDVSSVQAGLYILRVTDEEGVNWTTRLVILQ